MRAKLLPIFVCLFAAGCGRYADFTLPSPRESAHDVRYRVDSRPAPLLGRGAAGDWDSSDVLNPSVVLDRGVYYNLYSGFDGHTWRTGLATSRDGIAWTKEGEVLAPDSSTWEGNYIAANGSALVRNGEFLYWYQAGSPPRIGMARSPDARPWTKLAKPVLGLGPRGSWDEEGVADPDVAAFGDSLYLFYLGQDRARRQRLGIAVSNDGAHWTKLRSNPILELGDAQTFDENGLGEPAVWAVGGWYWMLYTGRSRAEHRAIGLARSRDGIHWNRVSAQPIFTGREAWNSAVVCDPSIEVQGSSVRVWYGGGDIPHPDERLNGQIGLFTLATEAW